MMSKKDLASWLRILSEICVNLSSGWFGFILISPGFQLFKNFSENILPLTWSFFLGIVFMWFSYKLDKINKDERK